jgi:hypothetical protein
MHQCNYCVLLLTTCLQSSVNIRRTICPKNVFSIRFSSLSFFHLPVRYYHITMESRIAAAKIFVLISARQFFFLTHWHWKNRSPHCLLTANILLRPFLSPLVFVFYRLLCEQASKCTQTVSISSFFPHSLSAQLSSMTVTFFSAILWYQISIVICVSCFCLLSCSFHFFDL